MPEVKSNIIRMSMLRRLRSRRLIKPVLDRELYIKRQLKGRELGRKVSSGFDLKKPSFLNLLRRSSRIFSSKIGRTITVISLPLLTLLVGKAVFAEEKRDLLKDPVIKAEFVQQVSSDLSNSLEYDTRIITNSKGNPERILLSPKTITVDKIRFELGCNLEFAKQVSALEKPNESLPKIKSALLRIAKATELSPIELLSYLQESNVLSGNVSLAYYFIRYSERFVSLAENMRSLSAFKMEAENLARPENKDPAKRSKEIEPKVNLTRPELVKKVNIILDNVKFFDVGFTIDREISERLVDIYGQRSQRAAEILAKLFWHPDKNRFGPDIPAYEFEDNIDFIVKNIFKFERLANYSVSDSELENTDFIRGVIRGCMKDETIANLYFKSPDLVINLFLELYNATNRYNPDEFSPKENSNAKMYRGYHEKDTFCDFLYGYLGISNIEKYVLGKLSFKDLLFTREDED